MNAIYRFTVWPESHCGIFGQRTLRMNVSREADRAFRFDLKKADPKRWAALDAGLQRDFYRRQRKRSLSIAEPTDVAA